MRSWSWPDAEEYGEQWAHDYDTLSSVAPEWTDATVAALADLAAGGTVLEVAAGTGRVALPLARKGIDVTATDASPRMLERLASKAGTGLLRTRVEVLPAVGGTGYSVIAILANSVWVLETSRAQQEFLHNAASCLAPNGVVVVEMGVVDPTRWNEPRQLQRGGEVARLTTVWDAAAQRARHRFHFQGHVHPPQRDVYVRYLRPDQLLTMAAAAGLEALYLRSDWHGAPFRPGDQMMIAVLRRHRQEAPGPRLVEGG